MFDYCSGAEHARGKDAQCTVAFKYGMKRDFNAWLASLGPSAPVKTLTELRNWNMAHAKAGAIRYQQSRLDISDEMDLVADKARYDADHAKDHRLSRDQGIDAVLRAHQLEQATKKRAPPSSAPCEFFAARGVSLKIRSKYPACQSAFL